MLLLRREWFAFRSMTWRATPTLRSSFVRLMLLETEDAFSAFVAASLSFTSPLGANARPPKLLLVTGADANSSCVNPGCRYVNGTARALLGIVPTRPTTNKSRRKPKPMGAVYDCDRTRVIQASSAVQTRHYDSDACPPTW